MKNIDMYTESFKLKYEEFLNGCDAIEEEGLWDKGNLGEMEAYYANDLVSIIIRLIATDGLVSEKEVEYLNETFDFDYTLEELALVYESCREDLDHSFDESFKNGITYMREINEKLAEAYKELLSLVCTIIVESDGVIGEEELDEVKRLQSLCGM